MTLWLILGVGLGAVVLLAYVILRVRRDARKAVDYEHMSDDVRLRNEAREADRGAIAPGESERLRKKYGKRQ